MATQLVNGLSDQMEGRYTTSHLSILTLPSRYKMEGICPPFLRQRSGQASGTSTQSRPDYGEAWAFLGEARQHLPSTSEQQAQSLIELEKAYQLDPESIAANSFLGLY